MESSTQTTGGAPYPVQYSVEYPDRDLNRLTTGFRLIVAIPILILAGTVGGHPWAGWGPGAAAAAGAGGVLFLAPLLMIVFRQKYPRWWYDWNLELLYAAASSAASRPVSRAQRSTLLQRQTADRPSVPTGFGKPGPEART